jgi:hypothetical protein
VVSLVTEEEFQLDDKVVKQLKQGRIENLKDLCPTDTQSAHVISQYMFYCYNEEDSWQAI